MPVIIGGNAIIPAPQVVLKKNFQELGDGRIVSYIVGATLNGYLVATMDGYTRENIPLVSRLGTIIAKQHDFRQLFATDGQLFEVQGFDGTAPVKFNAKVKSINFEEGSNWVEVCPYIVELEGVDFAGDDAGNTNYVESSTESWNFEDNETPHTYRVTHSMSAKGKTVYNVDGTLTTLAWQNAKAFVVNKLSPNWGTATSPWSPQSGQTIWQNSEDYDSVATTAYNRTVTESLDELEGTYSLTETFILSANNYTQDLSVSVRKVTGEPLTTTVITIQGVIHGLYTTLHDYETRLINAKAAWASIQPTLLATATSYAPSGVTLDSRPLDGQFDENPTQGTITYNYTFSDRRITNDTFESYTLDLKSSYQNPVVSVSVVGTIEGVLYADDTDPTVKYTRALAQWQLVKLLLYGRVLTEFSGLQAYPVENSVTYDQIGGRIGYSFSYDNRPTSNVIDDFTVSQKYSREDGRTTIAVVGTIQGLFSTITSGNPQALIAERFSNAQTYWEGIKDSLLGRATTYGYDVSVVNPVAYGTEVSENSWQGTISYNWEFNSLPLPQIAGALSEIITIVDNFAYPVVAVQGIPGRSQGPIIQSMSTKTVNKRTVTYEFVMPVNYSMSSQINSGGFLPPTIDPTPFTPVYTESLFQQEPQQTWTASNGRGSFSISWLYV